MFEQELDKEVKVRIKIFEKRITNTLGLRTYSHLNSGIHLAKLVRLIAHLYDK